MTTRLLTANSHQTAKRLCSLPGPLSTTEPPRIFYTSNIIVVIKKSKGSRDDVVPRALSFTIFTQTITRLVSHPPPPSPKFCTNIFLHFFLLGITITIVPIRIKDNGYAFFGWGGVKGRRSKQGALWSM